MPARPRLARHTGPVSGYYRRYEIEKAYGQPPDRDSPKEAVACTQSQSLENVRATANAAVNSDRDSSFCNRSAHSQRVKGRGDAVQLSTAVVGNDNAVKPMLNREFHVLGGENFPYQQAARNFL